MKNKRLAIFLMLATIITILVPLVFNANWSFVDYFMAAALLFTLSFCIDFVLRKSKNKNLLIAIFILIFLLIWLELAVGVFGSPWAGS